MSDQKLKLVTKLAYSVGHFHNDLCASMWFAYLLIFLKEVIGFSSISASNLLLIGQIVDGVATPVVGFLADKTNGFFFYTKRKSWHLFGTILVAISFPFIFRHCLIPGLSSDSIGFFMCYVIFIVLFQVGWAIVQNSHFSLISKIPFSNIFEIEVFCS